MTIMESEHGMRHGYQLAGVIRVGIATMAPQILQISAIGSCLNHKIER